MLEQLAIVIYIIPFLLIAFVIAALRGDHDEGGKRSRAVYLGSVSLITIALAATAVVMITSAILKATHLNDFKDCGPEGAFYSQTLRNACDDVGNAAANDVWQTVVKSLLVLLVAGYLWIWHRNKINELKGESGYNGSAAERSIRAFGFLIAFLAVVVIIVGKIGAAYAIFQIIAPGVFGAADRGAGLREFIQLAVVTLVGWGVLWLYKDETGVFIKWPFLERKSAESA